ncbi:MAG: thiol oxidoreductase [Bryobacterales bacterium]|nr:thiol oxidoreductase [Bryobacterales bacterium]
MRSGAAGAGEALAGLNTAQLRYFLDGKEAFEEESFVKDPPPNGDAGLGPGFNGLSCGQCHAAPAAGGTSPALNPQIEAATKFGARNVVPPFLSLAGPVRVVRFARRPDGSPDGGVHNLFVITGRQDAAGCNARQEDFSNATNLRFRIPTPVFGGGLLEAIPDAALEQNLAASAAEKRALGIAGRFNRSDNDGTITRFGWKAQVKSLSVFGGEAYNVEMGVSNLLFPQERNAMPGCIFHAGPEDDVDFEAGDTDDVPLFAAFMRFLAPPAPAAGNSEGRALFAAVGCAGCHTPSLRTGASRIAALHEKEVGLYSDLALHRMGPALADDISQGVAGGDEWRTAPLWGLGKRIFFLHDGRSKDLVETIRMHGGQGSDRYQPSEATGAVQRFNELTSAQQQALLAFLRSL